MKKDIFAVYASTLYVVVYIFFFLFGVDYALIATMFTVSPLVVGWVVYQVLVSPDEPTRTFSEYFYMDVNIRSNQSK